MTASTTTTPSVTTTTVTVPPGNPDNHFQCYEIRPPGTFTRSGVELVDQFGASTVELRRAYTLCAPADKNDEDPTAPADPGHLTAYGVRAAARFARVPAQRVVNQFGTLVVDVVKPARLLVPTAKGEGGQPPASPVLGLLDHFQCYKVKRTKGEARFARVTGVKVDTQFEDGAVVDLVKPLRLCAPADKNGETPGAETHAGHLLCYRTRAATGIATRGVNLANQFGAQDYLVSQRREFCVPSLKNPPPTTTSSSTSTSSTTTQPPMCGNGVREVGEHCDGTDLDPLCAGAGRTECVPADGLDPCECCVPPGEVGLVDPSGEFPAICCDGQQPIPAGPGAFACPPFCIPTGGPCLPAIPCCFGCGGATSN